jgi:hypothetical protein
MGYTHYITFKDSLKTKDYKLALRQITRLVRRYNKAQPEGSNTRLSGFTAHAIENAYEGVKFNGAGDYGCEDFWLPADPFEDDGNDFHFCKTNQMPYDIVVVAALCLLSHYCKNGVTISSDGDAADWQAGLLLAQKFVKSVKMPNSIRVRLRSESSSMLEHVIEEH